MFPQTAEPTMKFTNRDPVCRVPSVAPGGARRPVPGARCKKPKEKQCVCGARCNNLRKSDVFAVPGANT